MLVVGSHELLEFESAARPTSTWSQVFVNPSSTLCSSYSAGDLLPFNKKIQTVRNNNVKVKATCMQPSLCKKSQ